MKTQKRIRRNKLW